MGCSQSKTKSETTNPVAHPNKKMRVKAEAIFGGHANQNYVMRPVEKSEEDKDFIWSRLKDFIIMEALDEEQRQNVLSVMEPVEYPTGTEIMKQGDEADYMYVIEHGGFEVLIQNAEGVDVIRDAFKATRETATGKGIKLFFGEIAIMNSVPRTATFRTNAPSKVWRLELDAYNFICMSGAQAKTATIKEFLTSVDILRDLDPTKRDAVARALTMKSYEDGQVIFRQGEPGDALYIVYNGEVSCTQIPSAGEAPKHLRDLGRGECFGEKALIGADQRTATVTAKGPLDCLMLNRDDFINMLGSMREVMQEMGCVRTLDTVPVLQDLSASSKQHVIANMGSVEYAPGAVILGADGEINTFYIIVSGEVDVFALDSNKHINSMTEGDYFGEGALLDQAEGKEAKRTAKCVAKTTVQCRTITKSDFNTYILPAAKLHKTKKVNNPYADVEFKDLKTYKTLGAGAFGRVKLVQWQKSTDKPKKTFALKCLSMQQIDETGHKQSVINEKKCMQELMGHPFIPSLFATFKDEARLYMMMELLLGGELFNLVQTYAPLPPQQVKFYAAQVVCVFEELQDRGYVYRDLKPENIMIDADGYIKLVDFGFAKKVHGGITHTTCGTPDYLAPEVVQRKGHSYGFDWWALGILIYEMIYSVPPFYSETGNNYETYKKIMQYKGTLTFPKVGKGGPDRHEDAKDLILKLLRPNPSLRLGCLKGGAMDVKQHRYFAGTSKDGKDGYQWPALLEKKYRAPWKPNISSNTDVSFFPDDYEQPDKLKPYKKDKSWFADW